MSCWGLTTGNAGMVAQVKALAHALGMEPQMKLVDIKPALAWVPGSVAARVRPWILPHFLDSKSDALEAPWPEIVISCGRRAAMVAMGLRAKAPLVKFIHIQDPQGGACIFDLVVAMEHDKINAANVIKTRYALHSILPERLRDAAEAFAPQFAAYAKPHVAVLLGGSTNKYTLGKEAFAQVVVALQQLLQRMEGSLLITPSRRTGEENIAMLRQCFAGNPRAYVYDFESNNPYMGMLALADAFIVTNDSVNMMSEARATGKPLYLLPLRGHTDTKPARFAQMLLAEGSARLLGNRIEKWSYPVADDMGQLAQEVKRRLGL